MRAAALEEWLISKRLNRYTFERVSLIRIPSQLINKEDTYEYSGYRRTPR